jgi:DNA polymerase IV
MRLAETIVECCGTVPTAMHRVIFHLDMDAFFAAIEQRDNPELLGKPVIVGAPPTQRGVVCAASYEARKFGVHSAMPSSVAGRLCPRGIFVRPQMELYKEESRRIRSIMAETDALIEPMSIDEAYLDLSAVCQADDVESSLEEGLPVAGRLKERIRLERGLTASIGIASNKLLAKIASDFQKPDGLTLIPERSKIEFLRPLPVRILYGVGRVTEQSLLEAGIRTIGDLQDYGGDLRAVIGSFGLKLRQFAFGEDDRPLELDEQVKSISSEETFLEDTEDRRRLRACLRAQADEISAKLKRRQLGAHTVQVKVRYSDFTTLTRQVSIEEPVSEAGDIYRLGCFLLGRQKLVSRPLRLLGLGVSGLREPAQLQLMLF